MDRDFHFLNPTRRQYLAGTMGIAAATAASPASAWTALDEGTPAAIARREGDRLILSNGVVSRTVQLPSATRSTIGTTDFRTVARRSRYFTGESDKFRAEADEFGFLANDTLYSGKSGWTLGAIADAVSTLFCGAATRGWKLRCGTCCTLPYPSSAKP
jgi:hypothetical protein